MLTGVRYVEINDRGVVITNKEGEMQLVEARTVVLAAIQKLVFDDKKYTMEQLLKALEADWQGYEEMWQDFLNAPKYGNDDDYADDWARKPGVGIENVLSQVKDAWGYTFTSSGSTAVPDL